jgi:cell wall-associated NlpC family hydrolase
MGGGLVLGYSGVKNATVSDTLRALIKGQPVTGSPVGSVAAAASEVTTILANVGAAPDPSGGPATAQQPPLSGPATGQQGATGYGIAIVNAARKYLGIKYVFGGANPAKGLDCSGLVTWVLHHDLGLNLPSNTHTVTGQFYIWPGAVTVPWADMQPGDLVCWTGHIGIVTTPGRMINAPKPGGVVSERAIYTVPRPLIRRVKVQ